VVLPKALRDQHGWVEGVTLVFSARPGGAMVMSADEALAAARASLAGAPSLAEELIAERRAEAAGNAR
jgi:bifunctional DNA-binding transcriptional regulator/antitoxin component of YhaV-PrlF toxin-antitoxin module